MTFDEIKTANKLLKEKRITQGQFFEIMKGNRQLLNKCQITESKENQELERLKNLAIESGLYYEGMPLKPEVSEQV
jgi:hypothetical protein